MKSVVMRRLQMLAKLILNPMLLALLLLIGHCGASAPALEHQCTHDTEEKQTKMYGPVVDAKTGLRHGFTPRGILERTAPQQYQPVPPPDAPEDVHHAFHATEVSNIRIVVSSIDVDEPIHDLANHSHCTAIGDRIQNLESTSGSITCTSDDILTDAKRKTLLNEVLRAALGNLSGVLKVQRVTSNLIVNKTKLKSTNCRRYAVPASHYTTGVPGADYVLYVSAAPSEVPVSASYCMIDQAGRPVAGMLNIAPKYIVNRRQYIRTVMHHMLHALGFTYPSFKKLTIGSRGGEPIAWEYRRGYRVKYLKSNHVVEKAREHFNCSTLKGPELENELYGSHWKRRNHIDDIMSPAPSKGMYLTPVTLAVMADSGHYMIDWSKAENPKWMYKAGCGVINKKCNKKEGGLGKYFCNDDKLDTCAADHRSYGRCGITSYHERLFEPFRYIERHPNRGGGHLMDYCPVRVRAYCRDNERCFVKDLMREQDTSGPTINRVSCLKTRCVNKTVQFKISANTHWTTCPSVGAGVTITGYAGTVTCPDPSKVCEGVEANLTPTTTPTKTTSPSATPTTSTSVTPSATPTATKTKETSTHRMPVVPPAGGVPEAPKPASDATAPNDAGTPATESGAGTALSDKGPIVLSGNKQNDTATTTATSATPTAATNTNAATKPNVTTTSATVMSSTIPAVLMSSVVFLYLYNW